MDDYTGFDGATFRAFRDLPRQGVIQMLNLVRLRERAIYDDGRTATGAEAYAAYGRATAPVLARLGGRIVWRGRPELVLIGPVDERWDLAFIAEYPSVEAFTAMIKDPEYRAAMLHREAAVKTSRLVRMEPLEAGQDFGG